MNKIRYLLITLLIFTYSCENHERKMDESLVVENAIQTAFIELSDYVSKKEYIIDFEKQIDSLYANSQKDTLLFIKETIKINDLIINITDELLKIYNIDYEYISNFREMEDEELIMFLDFEKPLAIMFGVNNDKVIEKEYWAWSLQASLKSYFNQSFLIKNPKFIDKYITAKYLNENINYRIWALTLDYRSLISILNILADLRKDIYILALNKIKG